MQIFYISFVTIGHKIRAIDESRTHDLFLTKEALYHWATTACFLLKLKLKQCFGLSHPRFRLSILSGKRGSNPPPIAWKAIALPNELFPLLLFGVVGKSGLEPLNSEEDRFTVCCNCHYATSPCVSRQLVVLLRYARADEGTRTPDRLITNQLLYQLSYIGFFWQSFKQLSVLAFFSLKKRCKSTTFSDTNKVFFHFSHYFFLKVLFLKHYFFHFFCNIPIQDQCKTAYSTIFSHFFVPL